MKQIIKSQKGIGIIIAVFAAMIIILALLSTVPIYMMKMVKTQSVIKEVNQGHFVTQQFAQQIRDAYDNYVSNGFAGCTTGFTNFDVGNLRLCVPTGTTHLEVQHLGKTYYIPLTDLRVN